MVIFLQISPLLLKKDETRLALFGLGAVRDERLHRMFLQDKVKFLTLADKTAACREWFNMFVLHQNRAKHGQTNYIPEKMLPDFFDLVIWDPTPSAENEFFVMQPGSSVATALSEGEAGDKFVAILKIKGKDFKVEKLKLKTVRQFYFQRLTMSETKITPNRSDT
uniref:Uncharacterized protein n=1 Tax=Romanomermis culicivorax TaxID=13658 RepID=A0A915ICR0_ROMCU